MPEYTTERRCKVTKYTCLTCEKLKITANLIFTGNATRSDLDDVVKGSLSFEHKCERCESIMSLPSPYPIVDLLPEEKSNIIQLRH